MKFAHFAQPFPRPDMSVKERHDLLCRELALADRLGFDYGFVAEQHLSQTLPSPALYCAYAAAHTKHLRVGPMGYVVPFYDPIRLYEESALLDNALGGRLELGLVPGIIRPHFKLFEADWDNRRARANEFVGLVKTAAASPQSISFKGPYHSYEDVRPSVQYVQQPHPPIWLMSRTREQLHFLAREGIRTGNILFGVRREVAPAFEEYLGLWREAGHSAEPQIGYITFGYVDETDEKAIEKASPHILHSLAMIYGIFGPNVLADGYMRRGEAGSAEIARNMSNIDFFLQRQLVFVGSPKTVAEQIAAAASEGCFNTLFFEFNLGTMAEADVMRSIELFGTKVLPALRGFEPPQFRH